MRTVALLAALLVALPALATVGEGTSLPPGFAVFHAPDGLPNADNAGEPSIGVDPATNAALFQAYSSTWRVTFDAAGNPAWRDVTPPSGLGFNLDPILTTDREAGVTYAGGLEGVCSVLWSTANDGATWSPLGNACAAPAFDHETIFAGPAAAPLAGRNLYYCAHADVVFCATSPNGGTTFLPDVPADVAVHTCLGTVGHGRVAPDGTVFLPSAHCQLGAGVMVSTTNGLTWTTSLIPNSLPPPEGFDPSLAVTPSGWLYAAFQNGQGKTMVSLTKDEGAHWSAPRDAAAGIGLASTTYAAIVAGDDQRAAVAFLGTTTPGDGLAAGFAGSWDLYVSFTYDGGQSWTPVKVSPSPVQRGWICATGLTCTGGRNLLDFLDATTDAQGHVLVAYADGCMGCADEGGSYHAHGSIARQTSGAGLLAAYD